MTYHVSLQTGVWTGENAISVAFRREEPPLASIVTSTLRQLPNVLCDKSYHFVVLATHDGLRVGKSASYEASRGSAPYGTTHR